MTETNGHVSLPGDCRYGGGFIGHTIRECPGCETENCERLTFARLRDANVRRCEAPDGFNHPLAAWNALEWAGAMCGEAGEACNVAKKMRRLETGVTHRTQEADADILRMKLADELGDVVIYADLLAQRAGLDLGKCVAKKFDRTSSEIGYGGERLSSVDTEKGA